MSLQYLVASGTETPYLGLALWLSRAAPALGPEAPYSTPGCRFRVLRLGFKVYWPTTIQNNIEPCTTKKNQHALPQAQAQRQRQEPAATGRQRCQGNVPQHRWVGDLKFRGMCSAAFFNA